MPQPVTDAMELGLVMELLAGPTLLEPIRGRGHLPREERLGGKGCDQGCRLCMEANTARELAGRAALFGAAFGVQVVTETVAQEIAAQDEEPDGDARDHKQVTGSPVVRRALRQQRAPGIGNRGSKPQKA